MRRVELRRPEPGGRWRSTLLVMLAAALASPFALAPPLSAKERTVTAAGVSVTNYGLVGAGRLPADLRDKPGETFGSGSSMAVASWKRGKRGSYDGQFLLLPDRGHNTVRPIDYRARINRLAVRFTPVPVDAQAPGVAGQSSIALKLEAPIKLTDADGKRFTGLDPQPDETAAEPGETAADDPGPLLPRANGHVAIDPEGLVRADDGTLYVSDEYGPYIYVFSPEGALRNVIVPPPAFLPMRDGKLAFSAEKPQPDSGRVNNRGLEGLSLTPDGRYLFAALQSPTVQDGGKKGAYTRVLVYDTAQLPHIAAEYAVELPEIDSEEDYAAQSEVLALSYNVILMLARDSDRGYGTGTTAPSQFRNIGVVDLAAATNIIGRFDGPAGSVVDAAENLRPGVDAAVFQPLIDLNDAGELSRFGLHNGGDDPNTLSEKWEALALVSALDPAQPDDYFLFVANDNDFITRNGHHAGADYHDAAGVEVDTMFLVYRLRITGLPTPDLPQPKPKLTAEPPVAKSEVPKP